MLGRKLTHGDIIKSITIDKSCLVPLETIKNDERYIKYSDEESRRKFIESMEESFKKSKQYTELTKESQEVVKKYEKMSFTEKWRTSNTDMMKGCIDEYNQRRGTALHCGCSKRRPDGRRSRLRLCPVEAMRCE
jgi:TPP-dependent 2-oxoacid decarboxylase